MTSDEAVEAAARAAFDSAWRGCSWAGPNPTTEETRERFRREARAALEAAAPHMLNLAKREAWDANVEIQRLRAELAKLSALRPYTVEDQRQHGETW